MMIFTFNTGRYYTAQGQRITVKVHDDGTVDFKDHDRLIDGRLHEHLPRIVPADIHPIAAWIMRRYDEGLYGDLPFEAMSAVAFNADAPVTTVAI